MLKGLNIERVLFLDIETVPNHANYAAAEDSEKALWNHKAKTLSKGESSGEEIYERAGIYAEFGKIVCISVGYLNQVEGGKHEFRTRSFFGNDEALILKGFADLLNNHFNRKEQLLCGHNAKEFDFPYIARRMIINQVEIPRTLDMSGLKPWQVPHLDTMELWKFGDWKSYTSLKLMAHVLKIPTPKDDIDGSDVARVYYVEKDLDRIERYCRKDTLAVAQILLRLIGKPLIDEADVVNL
jgi:3'-5' exonuclease